ncbi:hypothetical protein D3C86_1888560 [compost metagenome]
MKGKNAFDEVGAMDEMKGKNAFDFAEVGGMGEMKGKNALHSVRPPNSGVSYLKSTLVVDLLFISPFSSARRRRIGLLGS